MFQLYYFLPGRALGLRFHVYLVMRFGGTPGKRMLGLRIVCLDGSPVGLREACVRHCVLFALTTLSTLGLILATPRMSDAEYLRLPFRVRGLRLIELAPSGHHVVSIVVNVWIWSEFVVMLANRRRRGVHDFMAGTVVIRDTEQNCLSRRRFAPRRCAALRFFQAGRVSGACEHPQRPLGSEARRGRVREVSRSARHAMT